jgi:hypothetical protein
LSSNKTLNGNEPIGQDEIVFRRVFVGHYKKQLDYLSPKGFNPRACDTTGISLCRADYLPEPKAEAAAALGPEGMTFWVIELNTKELHQAGMEVIPEPSESFNGHASIPILNAANIGSSETIELTELASKLPRKVHGPFPGKTPR